MIEDKSIELLINEDFVYAKVLGYFGVEFYKSRHKTLKEVCNQHDIDLNQLTVVLESSKTRNEKQTIELKHYPLRLIIEYLKHSHQLFVKDRLPFILKQIGDLDTNLDSELIQDLRTVLPMFVTDFIHHIYEEEDRLFSYISRMEQFLNGKLKPSELMKKAESFSIQEFALHHEDSDDTMKGIRGITGDYQTNDIDDIKLRVVFQGLKALDQELTTHAKIENDILFPQALILEKQVKEKLNENSSLN